MVEDHCPEDMAGLTRRRRGHVRQRGQQQLRAESLRREYIQGFGGTGRRPMGLELSEVRTVVGTRDRGGGRGHLL